MPVGIPVPHCGLLYVPIPKAACTSLKSLMGRLLGSAELERCPHDVPFSWERLPSKQYHSLLSFTAVRNPWNRLASCFCSKIFHNATLTDEWMQNGVARFLLRYGGLFYGGMSFEAFVHAVCAIPDDEADNHFRSQFTFITADGSVVVDDICHVETLQADMDAVFRSIGMEPVTIPALNPRWQNQENAHYTPALHAMVAQRYATDIALFGYEKADSPSKNTFAGAAGFSGHTRITGTTPQPLQTVALHP